MLFYVYFIRAEYYFIIFASCVTYKNIMLC
nr:MAG TPA: hypothetical protein [Caudoviricetes sp.]